MSIYQPLTSSNRKRSLQTMNELRRNLFTIELEDKQSKITGSPWRSTVLTATEWQNSTPHRSETPSSIDWIFKTVDYVRETTPCAKFRATPSTGGFFVSEPLPIRRGSTLLQVLYPLICSTDKAWLARGSPEAKTFTALFRKWSDGFFNKFFSILARKTLPVVLNCKSPFLCGVKRCYSGYCHACRGADVVAKQTRDYFSDAHFTNPRPDVKRIAVPRCVVLRRERRNNTPHNVYVSRKRVRQLALYAHTSAQTFEQTLRHWSTDKAFQPFMGRKNLQDLNYHQAR